MASMPEAQRAIIAAMGATAGDMSLYTDAVRDWANNGAASRYVLPADEVIRRSRPRPPEAALAAAEYELGQHLHRDGPASTPCPTSAGPRARSRPTGATSARPAPSPTRRGARSTSTDLFTEVGKVGPETWRPLPDM